MATAVNSVWHTPDFSSHLLLPEIPGDGDADESARIMAHHLHHTRDIWAGKAE